MTYNPIIHHRRSIRLNGYDYAQAGAYFITICTKNRQCLFGHVEYDKMILTDAGNIAYNEWLKTPHIRPNVVLDVFIIMPNHIHGIIIITNDRRGESNSPKKYDGENRRGELHSPCLIMGECNSPLQSQRLSPPQSPSQTIGAIVPGYKSAVTKQIKLLDNTIDTVWQRNYYEHIIHDARAYQNISNYIINNPLKWPADKFYEQ